MDDPECMMGTKIFLTLLLLLLAGGDIFCSTAYSETQTLTVEGQAPVIAKDRPQARDGAITDARRRAIEQSAGVTIEAESIFSHEMMISSTLRSSTSGMIEQERIISESHGEDGIYRVTLEAVVSSGKNLENLRKMLREDRIVLQVFERHLDGPSEISILQNELTRQLNRNGYQQIVHVKAHESGSFDDRSDPDAFGLDAAGKLAVKHLADIVVAGSLSAKASAKLGDNLYSAHAQGWIRVFTASRQRLLASGHFSAVRGYGPDTRQAATDALKNISDLLTREVMDHVAEKSLRTIEVTFYGIADFDQFKRYKNLLSLMRWVQDVSTGGFSPAKTDFTVQYAESTEILASRLDQFPSLSISSFDEWSIEVVANGL